MFVDYCLIHWSKSTNIIFGIRFYVEPYYILYNMRPQEYLEQNWYTEYVQCRCMILNISNP